MNMNSESLAMPYKRTPRNEKLKALFCFLSALPLLCINHALGKSFLRELLVCGVSCDWLRLSAAGLYFIFSAWAFIKDIKQLKKTFEFKQVKYIGMRYVSVVNALILYVIVYAGISVLKHPELFIFCFVAFQFFRITTWSSAKSSVGFIIVLFVAIAIAYFFIRRDMLCESTLTNALDSCVYPIKATVPKEVVAWLK